MTKYTFAKDVDREDWHPLPRSFKKGETIYRYNGHDYGCARDDCMAGTPAISCCETEGETPFFTVPVVLLLDDAGKHPRSGYI